MGKYPQSPGEKGSLKWIQHYVNQDTKTLNDAIGDKNIEWFSPLADDYAEYRDQDFLDVLGISLDKMPLNEFWPSRGPQWDALGKSKETGEVFLIEAKSHISEMFSSSKAESSESIKKIKHSLDKTAQALKAKPGFDWSECFYQYTNRIAHAYLLNNLNSIPAKLIFVNFCNDPDMDGPQTQREWEAALTVLHEALGITGKIPDYIKHIYLDLKN